MTSVSEPKSHDISQGKSIKKITIEQVEEIFGKNEKTNKITKALNTIISHNCNITKAAAELRANRNTLINYIDQYNAAVSESQAIKRNVMNFHSEDIKEKVVALFNSGLTASEIRKQLGISESNVYYWTRRHRDIKRRKRVSKNNIHPAVSKVIEDISNKQVREKKHSLASDFGVSANAEKEETNNPVELKFCPCCGTNIKAVRIALQTCQEMR